MLDSTLISVIVPCYNGAATLKRCIDCVLGQTYQNWELLLVDDGSYDDSLRIAEAAAKKDRRVRVFARKNQGVSAARNFGMRNARGAFVQFLDADDEMLPTMLERLYTAITKENADAAVCNFFGNPMFLSALTDRVYDLRDSRDLLAYVQETFGFVVPWNKLMRKSALEGLAFDETVHFAEDDLFNLAAAGRMEKIVALSEPLYHYHCAAQENGNSCIQQLVCDPNFVKEKHSIWYEEEKLIPHHRAIAAELAARGRIAPCEVEDLVYARVLDFFFWEISSYAVLGVDEDALIAEAEQVFAEPAFRHSYLLQEKYGLTFRRPTPEKIKGMAGEFLLRCLDSFADVRANAPTLNHGKIFTMLFLKSFAVELGGEIDSRGSLSRLMLELRAGESPEARYVNALVPNEGSAS